MQRKIDRTFLLRFAVGSLWLAAAVGLWLAGTQVANAQGPSCAWPLKTIGGRPLNVAAPDTNANYWTMPINTALYSSVVIHGSFPMARFISLTTYTAPGNVYAWINDDAIAPDPGSSNPFQPGASTGTGTNYSVTAEQGPQGVAIGNTIHLPSSLLAWIIYRVYVPNKGQNCMGGASLPTLTLVGPSGTQTLLPVCAAAACPSG